MEQQEDEKRNQAIYTATIKAFAWWIWNGRPEKYTPTAEKVQAVDEIISS